MVITNSRHRHKVDNFPELIEAFLEMEAILPLNDKLDGYRLVVSYYRGEADKGDEYLLKLILETKSDHISNILGAKNKWWEKLKQLISK